MGLEYSPERLYDPIAGLPAVMSRWRSSLEGLSSREGLGMEDAVIAFDSLFTRIPKIPLYNNVLLLARRLLQGRGDVLGVLRRVEDIVNAYIGSALSRIGEACGEALGGNVILLSSDALSAACAIGAARGGARVYVAWHDLMEPIGGGEGFQPTYFQSSFLYQALKGLEASLVVPLFSVTKSDALAPPQSLEAVVMAGDLGRRVVMVTPRLSIDPFFNPLSSLPLPRVVVEREIGYSFDFPAFDVIEVKPSSVILTERGHLEASLEALADAQKNVISELLTRGNGDSRGRSG